MSFAQQYRARPLPLLTALMVFSFPTLGHAQSNSIQMLPPVEDTTSKDVCTTSSSGKILSWDGVNALKCNGVLLVNDPPKPALTVQKPQTFKGVATPYGPPAASGAQQPNATVRINQSPTTTDMGRDQSGTFWVQNSAESNLAVNYPIALNPNGGGVTVGGTVPAAMLDVAGGVKVANDSNPCSATNAGTIRWTGTAMEYCNGTAWVGFSAPSLAASSTSYTGAAIGFVHDATRTLQSGTFTNADGYIGGRISCNGAWIGSNPGGNRLSVYLTINGSNVSAATAQDSTGTMDYWEIDAASFFSYVPKNAPWAVVVRANENATQNGPANCDLLLTRFGS